MNSAISDAAGCRLQGLGRSRRAAPHRRSPIAGLLGPLYLQAPIEELQRRRADHLMQLMAIDTRRVDAAFGKIVLSLLVAFVAPVSSEIHQLECGPTIARECIGIP
jgi:hypothetical protein